MLTMQDDPAYARAALQAGADGYVLKESACLLYTSPSPRDS